MRILLYTGKGGVGKTSVAAATALLAAEAGRKTVIMSSDPAHSLADSFDTPLSADAVSVAPNLWGQEIDALKELEVYWGTIQDWITALLRWQGVDEVVAEELAALPGMEELVALLYITRYHREGEYDLLVVDCAPTGETLRLLSFPDMARWYMNRLFPIEKKVATALGPVARGLLRLPVPGREVFDSIQELYLQLEEMRTLLLDPGTSSVRLVVNAEKMVIKEAQRTFTYLNLYGYHTDLVVCNRILPQGVGDSYFDSWKESQARYLKLIHESFDPIPVLQAPLMDREVVGLDALRELGGYIFNGQDPTQIFHAGQAQEVSKEGKHHILKVKLPFTAREELSIIEGNGELVVQAGRYRRNILLPRILAGLEVGEAQMEGETLKIVFKEDRRGHRGSRKAP